MSRRLPAVKPRQAIAALQRAGFVVRRVTGSHFRLSLPDDPTRWVVVGYHNGDLKPKTLRTKQCPISPVAIFATITAAPITPPGLFWPCGPWSPPPVRKYRALR
jgi:predicted RNA binding protein YcfA (HicA-like mRNA interferase family)